MNYVVNWKVRESLKETENDNELLSSKVGKFLSRVCYVEIVSMIFSQYWDACMEIIGSLADRSDRNRAWQRAGVHLILSTGIN